MTATDAPRRGRSWARQRAAERQREAVAAFARWLAWGWW